MNATATKKIALATLAAPIMAALAIGLAATASAESASDSVSQEANEGHQVVINKTGNAPLSQCSIIDTRQDRHEHHGGAQSDAFNTVYIDAYCPTISD